MKQERCFILPLFLGKVLIKKGNGRKVSKGMKRLLRTLMTVSVLGFSMSIFALAGTGTQASAGMGEEVRSMEEWELLQSAVTRTLSLDSMAAGNTMELNREGKNPITISTELKFKNRNSEELKYQIELHTVKDGAVSEERLFYSEGYYCLDADGQKLKISMDLEEAQKDLNYDPNSIGLAGLDSIQKLWIFDDGNGCKRYDFLCSDDGTVMNDYLYGILHQMDLIWEDFEIKEMKGSFSVNSEGWCTAQTMDIIMEIAGDNADADIKVDIVYENPGKPVDFALPSIEEYTVV